MKLEQKDYLIFEEGDKNILDFLDTYCAIDISSDGKEITYSIKLKKISNNRFEVVYT